MTLNRRENIVLQARLVAGRVLDVALVVGLVVVAVLVWSQQSHAVGDEHLDRNNVSGLSRSVPPIGVLVDACLIVNGGGLCGHLRNHNSRGSEGCACGEAGNTLVEHVLSFLRGEMNSGTDRREKVHRQRPQRIAPIEVATVCATNTKGQEVSTRSPGKASFSPLVPPEETLSGVISFRLVLKSSG
ncbi:MAG TPA: hypothetical protein K8V93_08425 [Corynebacterium pollutisoli]|nr:hypothetical protein [Corynebacterium pollutisoli]